MNTRPIWYQTRPSADRLGNAYHRHGALIPMEQPRRSLWQLLRARSGRHG